MNITGVVRGFCGMRIIVALRVPIVGVRFLPFSNLGSSLEL